MGWQSTVLQLTPLIVDLVQIAEKAFNHIPKSGRQKRNFVHAAAKDIIAGTSKATTGGAHETWEFIDKIAPPLIDVVAKHFFPDHAEPAEPESLHEVKTKPSLRVTNKGV